MCNQSKSSHVLYTFVILVQIVPHDDNHTFIALLFKVNS